MQPLSLSRLIFFDSCSRYCGSGGCDLDGVSLNFSLCPSSNTTSLSVVCLCIIFVCLKQEHGVFVISGCNDACSGSIKWILLFVIF